MMAKEMSQRASCNSFFGISEKAFDTNLRYHFLVAFHLFLHRQGATQMCVRSAENPGGPEAKEHGTRQFHPLTTNVMQQPKSKGAKGGLGMVMVTPLRLEP